MITVFLSYLFFSYILVGVMLTLDLIGLVVSAILPVLDRWSKHYFISLFSILLLTLIACFIDLQVFLDPNLAEAEKTAVFFEGVLLSVLAFMPTLYILHCCKKTLRRSALFYIEFSLLAVNIILILFAQFSPFFYYVTTDNQFVRGPAFPLLMLPMALMIIFNITAVIRERKVLSKKMVIASLVYLVPLTAAMIANMFVFAFQYIAIGIMLSALAMFCIILSEQVDQDRRQKREIARQQANIMILQMRPHFIYNSLTSVYYLCEQDPKKAQQVVMDFTTYLRKNFNALSSGDTIPFLDELSHTHAYLAVEKALHDDLLYIDYDTPHTRFRVPPLTLQPIVENAIKHGLDPDAEPLHISIRTCKTDSDTEIIVEDNGIGFEPADETDPNSALSNIRKRLKMVCRGTITITPRKDGGTVVKVIIPSE